MTLTTVVEVFVCINNAEPNYAIGWLTRCFKAFGWWIAIYVIGNCHSLHSRMDFFHSQSRWCLRWM